jgi:hypothetical protein
MFCFINNAHPAFSETSFQDVASADDAVAHYGMEKWSFIVWTKIGVFIKTMFAIWAFLHTFMKLSRKNTFQLQKFVRNRFYKYFGQKSF